MKLKLYSQNSVLKATFAPDNLLSLLFKHYDCIEIDVNDYIDFDDERFYAFGYELAFKFCYLCSRKQLGMLGSL